MKKYELPYIIKEMINYIYHFFVNYILLFSLVRPWTTLCLIICHHKIPERKWGWNELSGLMTSYSEDCPENFTILKRRLLRVDRWSERLSFSDLIRSDQISLGLDWQRWVEILNSIRCTARWGGGQHCRLSIGFYELCLSPWVVKDWRQKEINPFVSPELLFLLLILLWLCNIRSCQLRVK